MRLSALTFFTVSILCSSWSGTAAPEERGKSEKRVLYLNQMFAHLHEMKDKHSGSLTTLACGHPIQLLAVEDQWAKVRASGMKGHIQLRWLSEKRPDCFQGSYPQFFQGFELELSDFYFWGRLTDHYERFKTLPN